jgi:hypothetical protein
VLESGDGEGGGEEAKFNMGPVDAVIKGLNEGFVAFWTSEVLGFLLHCAQSEAQEPNKAPLVFKGNTLLISLGLLEPSLEDLFDHCNRRFSTKSVVMVNTLEYTFLLGDIAS